MAGLYGSAGTFELGDRQRLRRRAHGPRAGARASSCCTAGGASRRSSRACATAWPTRASRPSRLTCTVTAAPPTRPTRPRRCSPRPTRTAPPTSCSRPRRRCASMPLTTDGPIGVLGFSMGASWAMWLATRAPETVAATTRLLRQPGHRLRGARLRLPGPLRRARRVRQPTTSGSRWRRTCACSTRTWSSTCTPAPATGSSRRTAPPAYEPGGRRAGVGAHRRVLPRPPEGAPPPNSVGPMRIEADGGRGRALRRRSCSAGCSGGSERGRATVRDHVDDDRRPPRPPRRPPARRPTAAPVPRSGDGPHARASAAPAPAIDHFVGGLGGERQGRRPRPAPPRRRCATSSPSPAPASRSTAATPASSTPAPATSATGPPRATRRSPPRRPRSAGSSPRVYMTIDD